MLSNLKNPVPQNLCWPYNLTALQPYVRPTSSRHMGPVFLTLQVVAV